MRKQAQMRIYTLSRLKPDKTNDTQYSLWATACTYDFYFSDSLRPQRDIVLPPICWDIY